MCAAHALTGFRSVSLGCVAVLGPAERGSGSLPDPGQGSRIAGLPPRAQQLSLTAPSLGRDTPKCSEGAGIAPSSSLSSTGESGLSIAAAALGRKNGGMK